MKNAELIGRNFLLQSSLKAFPGCLVSRWNCKNPPWASLCSSNSFLHSVSSILKACELILRLQSDSSVCQRQGDVITSLFFPQDISHTDFQVTENSSPYLSICTCSEQIPRMHHYYLPCGETEAQVAAAPTPASPHAEPHTLNHPTKLHIHLQTHAIIPHPKDTTETGDTSHTSTPWHLPPHQHLPLHLAGIFHLKQAAKQPPAHPRCPFSLSRGKFSTSLVFFLVELRQAKQSPFFPARFSSRQVPLYFLFHFNHLQQKALGGTSDFKDTRSNVQQVIKTYTACVGQINIPSRASGSSVPAAP